MAEPYRERSPHPQRAYRLMVREQRAQASQERLPELLPCICPECRSVLGLVVAGGSILCRECGVWAEALTPVVLVE